MNNKKRFECQDGFAVESKDENEIVNMAKMHIKDKDKQDATDDYIKSSLQTV